MDSDVADIVERLRLKPHPEGGHYIETCRDAPPDDGRGVLTAIYYLLAAGEQSRWHRLADATELWLYHAGGPLELRLSRDGRQCDVHRIGPNTGNGEKFQLIVPAGCWQAARPLGGWTLVTCVVAPAFEFSSFELTPPDWEPGE